MAERGDADFLEIFDGHLAQCGKVEVIGPEQLGVLGQSDSAEPSVDVQSYPPGRHLRDSAACAAAREQGGGR